MSRLACLALAPLLAFPAIVHAQVYDPTGIKRCFLDRYLACAEAPSDAARLDCFDTLLADIPAWLEATPRNSGKDGAPLLLNPRKMPKEQRSADEQD